MFGDALRCATLAGDGWRTRHDRHKMEIMRLLGWSGVVASCEVTGLFAHLVPQEEMLGEEGQGVRQVMVPDFRMELPATTATGLATPGLHLAPGQSETRLAELKFYCGKSHFREGRRQRQFTRAVDRRAAELQGEYEEKADRADRRIGEEVEGRGRVRRRLDQFGAIIGIVAGLFNETSTDTLLLLDVMAKTRVEKLARASGLTAPQQEVEKGRVQGELRMLLSLSSLRASMACMLDRCNQIGDSAGLCTRRREVAVQVEEQMRRQREAQHLSRVRGGHILLRGHIMLQ